MLRPVPTLKAWGFLFLTHYTMAKDKKSFLMYTDQQGTFNLLPDEMAGKLIKHIFAYVNDENPATPDLYLQLAFEPIKQQLKRDLKLYEDVCKKRSESGKLGGRPKKQTEAKKANGFFEKQTKAKKADNDIDIDNDNDNDIDNVRNTDIPAREVFVEYGLSLVGNNRGYEFTLNAKFDSWIENKWRDGKGQKIKNWKTKLANTIPYLKPMAKDERDPGRAIGLTNIKYE